MAQVYTGEDRPGFRSIKTRWSKKRSLTTQSSKLSYQISKFKSFNCKVS